MGKRRLILATVALVLLAGIVTILWTALDWPPPRLILKYGLPPTGGPTGRVWTHGENEFVQVSPGYRHLKRRIYDSRGSWLSNVCASIGLRWGSPSERNHDYEDRWVEVRTAYWVTPDHLRGVYRRDEGGAIWLRDGIPGSLRRPTVDELWFAALTSALDLGPLHVLFDTGRATYPPSGDDRLLLGSGFAEIDSLHDMWHEVKGTVAAPVVWIPPKDSD